MDFNFNKSSLVNLTSLIGDVHQRILKYKGSLIHFVFLFSSSISANCLYKEVYSNKTTIPKHCFGTRGREQILIKWLLNNTWWTLKHSHVTFSNTLSIFNHLSQIIQRSTFVHNKTKPVVSKDISPIHK